MRHGTIARRAATGVSYELVKGFNSAGVAGARRRSRIAVADMKITRIETFKYWVDWCNWLFVRIDTDEGIVGWGEGSLHGALESVETAIREYAPHLSARIRPGPSDTGSGSTTRGAGAAARCSRPRCPRSTSRCGTSRASGSACRSRACSAAPFRTRLRGYASHWLQGADTPEKAFEGAREAVRRGFTAFKCRPFSFEGLRDNEAGEIRQAAALMEAAREGAGPDADIYIECSEFLSPRTAVMMDEALHPYRPGWFEEPIPFENPKAMAALQRDCARRSPPASGCCRASNTASFSRTAAAASCSPT